MLVPNKPMKWWINDCEYTKVIHLNCRWSIFPCHTFYLIKKSLLLVFFSFLIVRMVFLKEKLTEYRPKWRKSSVLFESWNEKRNIHCKSRLFPCGFSQGIQWARRVSQGSEELSLNTWVTLLKLNSHLVKYKSLSLRIVNKPSTESLWILQQQISGFMFPDRRGCCSSL